MVDNLREIAGVDIDQYTSATLQITKTMVLNAKSEQVFSRLTNYTAMPNWFPGMSEVKVDNSGARATNETGAVRICSFGPEQNMTEDIVIFDEPFKLGYAIRDGNFMGMSKHFALVTVEPENNGSKLSWYQFFDHPDPESFNIQGNALMDGAFKNLQALFTP